MLAHKHTLYASTCVVYVKCLHMMFLLYTRNACPSARKVEDWISKETLGDGKSGACPGPIVGSMGLPSQQWNGQLRPLLNTTIKGI